MNRILSLVVFWVGVAACGRFEEERWAERSAKVSCETARRCDTANFWFHYVSLDACIDDTVRASIGRYEGCTYDKKAARACERMMERSCRNIGEKYEELQAQCSAVWTCPEPTGDTGVMPL